ncbi:MAG: hypothetical protein ACREEM_02850 [Blastocatellia bacterium]
MNFRRLVGDYINKKTLLITLLILGLISSSILAAVRKRRPEIRGSQTSAIIHESKREKTPAPIKIEKIFVDGKEIAFETPFLASLRWVKTLQLEVRNISKDRTLVHVAIGVEFADADNIPDQTMSVGFPYPQGTPDKDFKDKVALKPGESLRLKWGQSWNDNLDHLYAQEASGMASISLYLVAAINSDRTTGWIRGEEGFRYESGGKVKWIYNSADWTDPELQKFLDPKYKQQSEKPRWDEESGQEVLDSASGQPCNKINGLDYVLCTTTA